MCLSYIFRRDKRAETTQVNNEIEATQNASRLANQPLVVTPTNKAQRVFFGRRVLHSLLDKNSLNAENILEELPEIMREHEKNRREIDYLYRYYKGEQPVLNKTKKVRPDINNVILENHAYEIVEFKKSHEFGEPVQYIQKGEKNSESISPELSIINKYMESEDKSSLDNQLAEWQYICGTAYRWIDQDVKDDADEAPFEMSIPDPRRTFVVYSSGIKEEPLYCGYFINSKDEKGNKEKILTIYTDKFLIKIKEQFGAFNVIDQEMICGNKKEKVKEYPLIIKGQRIIEYPLNHSRIGLIELVMTQLNALNQIKSDDLDGIDQFVQSLLVFVNQDVSVEDVRALEEAGAIKIYSSDPTKPADVKLLTQQLLHSETKIVTDDIYNNVLTILGIPRLNDKPSGGDTGQARLLGEGWTMAYQRANQDDLNFKKSERQFLKLVLSICKFYGKLKTIKISDIDVKIPRDKSDNLLVKAQSLQSLITAGVHPETAFTVVGLFGDPHDVYTKSSLYFGADFWKGKETEEVVDETKEDSKNEKTEEKPAEEKPQDNMK